MAITDKQLIDEYSRLHQSGHYGQSANNFALQIGLCLHELNPKNVLEYGCGQSDLIRLSNRSNQTWQRYDPAIPEFANMPEGKYDFAINTDVMEHIPPQDVADVLRHIALFTDKVFFNISTRPAGKKLSDGSNAHCTVMSADRWLEKIKPFFPLASITYVEPGEDVIIMTWNSTLDWAIAGIGELKTKERLARKGKNRHGLRKFVYNLKNRNRK